VRSTRVKTITAIVTIPMANVNILVVALKSPRRQYTTECVLEVFPVGKDQRTD